MQMLTNRNSMSPTYPNEIGAYRLQPLGRPGTSFPKKLPLLLFSVGGNRPIWLDTPSRVDGACRFSMLGQRPTKAQYERSTLAPL